MLEIIFEDEFIIVCKKMSGIPTQTPKSGVTDMVSLLKNYRVSKGEPPYIGLVHRLDQPVEGVMVFAKDKKSAAALLPRCSCTHLKNIIIHGGGYFFSCLRHTGKLSASGWKKQCVQRSPQKIPLARNVRNYPIKP